MTFAYLGEQLDDWLHVQHLRWIRLRRHFPWYTPPPVSEFATLWNQDLLLTAPFASTLDALVDRSFQSDINVGETIQINLSRYGDIT